MPKTIVASNDLLNGLYSPATLWQLRVLHAAMSQLHPAAPNNRDRLSVTAEQLAEITGERPTDINLKSAAKDLVSMAVTRKETRPGTPETAVEEYIPVVSECRYVPDERCIDLRFSEAMMPLISQLTTRFTRLDLSHVMRMRSAFGIRLYGLCMQSSALDDFSWTYDLQEFRRLMGLGEYKYLKFGDLNARVIRPALDDINQHTDMQVSCTRQLEGRKVVGLEFQITRPKTDNGGVRQAV